MRIAFLGTPPEAAVALQALHRAGHDVALVVTQPDRRRGRGGDTSPSPVKRTALELDLPVRTPEKAVEVVDELRGSGAELGVVVAFGQILPVPLLESLPHGFVNVHYSLLPRWRGAAPVERAILAGDAETGVCIMAVEEGLDTGGVYAEARISIADDDTAGQLRAELADLGAQLLVETIESIPGSTPHPQEGEATYARKLTPEEFELDWSAPAAQVSRMVRAANPNPGAWTFAGGRRLKIWRAQPADADLEPGHVAPDAPVVGTGEGGIRLVEVQVEGKQRVTGDDWRRGFRGDHLGAASPGDRRP